MVESVCRVPVKSPPGVGRWFSRLPGSALAVSGARGEGCGAAAHRSCHPGDLLCVVCAMINSEHLGAPTPTKHCPNVPHVAWWRIARARKDNCSESRSADAVLTPRERRRRRRLLEKKHMPTRIVGHAGRTEGI